MPIDSISRLVSEVDVSTTYSLTDPNINLIVANATSAGFTITIYNDSDSGSFHELVIRISDSDVSGNTVTIVDVTGAFSTTLASTSASVLLRTDGDGDWYAAATFPTEDAATAISAADSAGLIASTTSSEAVSAAAGLSSATSATTSAGSKATIALSAATSGTTLATSEATSGGAAASVSLSAAASGTTLATSEATSAGKQASIAMSVAIS